MTMFSDDILMLNAAEMEEWYERELIMRAETELRLRAAGGAPGVQPPAQPNLNLVPWVGFAASQFNMVNGQNFVLGQSPTAGYPGGWVIPGGNGHASVTAGMLGPDSTFTASLLVEDNTFQFHQIASLITFGHPNALTDIPMRILLIGKAGTRSRCVLQALDNSSGDQASCCIDFAGGNVGFDNQTTNWTIQNTSISQPLGNSGVLAGWFLCTFDFSIEGPNAVNCFSMEIHIQTDAGSGMAVRNNHYQGDGVSGINLWWCTVLPKAAFSFTGEVFRDDFTTLDTVDIHDTRAPGFNWYVHNSWRGSSQTNSCWTNSNVTPASFFSQSGSIMTIAGRPGNDCGFGVISGCAGNNPAQFTNGFTWQPPAIVEAMFAFDPTLTVSFGNTGGGGGHWHITPTIGIQNPLVASTELDPDDSSNGTPPNNVHCFFDITMTEGSFSAGNTSGTYGSSITDFRPFALMIFNPAANTNQHGFAMMFWRVPNDGLITTSYMTTMSTRQWSSSNTIVTQNQVFMSILTAGQISQGPGGGGGGPTNIPTAFDYYRIIK